MRARPEPLAFARQLRGRMTRAEVILWQALRGGRFAGRRFRRQQPFGPYVLDFYCPSAKLAVEVDGPVHREEPQAGSDWVRDRYLAERGLETLRVESDAVVGDLDAVLTVIGKALQRRAS